MEESKSITDLVREKARQELTQYAHEVAEKLAAQIRKDLDLPWYTHEMPLYHFRHMIASKICEIALPIVLERAVKKAAEKLS